jgi:sialic acid synthase SpsE
VALGACIYERHLVLNAEHDAIDRAVSSTPEELRDIIAAMEQTRAALGDGVKRCLPAELPNRAPSRRGVYAARALRAGDVLQADDIAVLRPASSVPPSLVHALPGSVLTRDLEAGAPLGVADLAQANVA